MPHLAHVPFDPFEIYMPKAHGAPPTRGVEKRPLGGRRNMFPPGPRHAKDGNRMTYRSAIFPRGSPLSRDLESSDDDLVVGESS
jgi:hypothetical protein